MRTFVLAAFCLTALGTTALAMGGGGGGGGYGGNMSMMPSASFDDYASAKRLIRHQEYASAIPHLMKALEQHPKDADILNYLGYTHRMVGVGEQADARDKDFGLSLAFYQQALAIDPLHKGVHEYLGELFLQMNDLNAAHHEMNELVILCPDGCDERDALAKALAAYVPPAAAASTAAP
ncbi:MAG TPA: tetratricopeptide repeat protein [Rhizomicrobium sp.]|jgi:tetratricopeptide (TPR) repeat protein|nr:tetratricopeptide repeat protein [Rhizomicrobium sp.]